MALSYNLEQPFEANSSFEHSILKQSRDEQRVVSVSAFQPESEFNVSKFAFTEHTNIRSTSGWLNADVRLEEFQQKLLRHTEVPDKFAAGAFIPGSICGDRRLASAVIELSAVVFDLDAGEDIEAVCVSIESMGLGAIIHSTHSHNETQAKIKIDEYRRWSGNGVLNVPRLQRYLSEVGKLRPWIVEDLEIITEHCETSSGAVCVVRHAPIPKYRLFLPLKSPFKLARTTSSDSDLARRWRATLKAIAAELGIECDPACSDLSRAYFYPSCPPGAQRFARSISGKRLDLANFEVDLTEMTTAKPAVSTTAQGKPAERVFEGFQLTKWIAAYGKHFLIESALRARAPNIIRAPRATDPGVHITCPFEETHTEPGGAGTFVVNASDNEGRGFGVHCCHAHCLTDRGDGKRVDRVLFLEGMLERGWLSLDDLQNAEVGGGAVAQGQIDVSASPADDLRALDREKKGIDLRIYYDNVIKRGLLDFELLNSRCSTQIGADVTAAQLCEFVQLRRITVEDLIACSGTNAAIPKDDSYAAALHELAIEKASGQLLDHDVDARLADIRVKHNVKQKAIEADFKKIDSSCSSGSHLAKIGVLSPRDAALINHMRDYARDFAFVNTGGKCLVMNLKQKDLSKALMSFDDFEKLHRNEWIETKLPSGQLVPLYPAKEFISTPPRSARVYHGGMVFKPSGTVPADQLNLYPGMQISGDAEGSCSLFHELIRDVWCQGDPETTAWVTEWLYHPIARPGERVGTCLAIRGEPGDGKSIVFQLLGKVLGGCLLRVTNHKMILGDFNEALLGKIVTVLEEAAFSGDKKAFDQMKELITGDTVLVNPKFKAPIAVDNYSRLVVISNHDHFLHIKPGDRRYTVLESTAAWQTSKFEQLVEQWDSGGAARFVHEALNHSFRHTENQQRLVINSIVKTPASVRQMALSRTSLEKCIVQFLVMGTLDGREGPALLRGSEASLNVMRWEVAKPLEISSLEFERVVARWVSDNQPVETRQGLTLHTIIGALHRYIGVTTEARPKGRSDDGGERVQLATVRTLPPRKEALQHAWTSGLITDEEYRAAEGTDSVALH